MVPGCLADGLGPQTESRPLDGMGTMLEGAPTLGDEGFRLGGKL